MGRKKIQSKKKKINISVSLDEDVNKKLNELKLNKSKFVTWLLVNYVNKETI